MTPRCVEEWLARVLDGEIITPSTPVEMLLAELYDIDTDPYEAMEGGRKPEDPLH